MFLTSPPILQFKSLFLHAPLLPKPTPPPALSPPALPLIRAMRTLQGKVICATNDKTVAVEVVRLAPHPKYKRRVRHKKKYQADDPFNQFKIGDMVLLEKCKPISKNKAFRAVPVPPRPTSRPKETPLELGIPLESQA